MIYKIMMTYCLSLMTHVIIIIYYFLMNGSADVRRCVLYNLATIIYKFGSHNYVCIIKRVTYKKMCHYSEALKLFTTLPLFKG
jgi:hypothetical protein